MPMHSHPRARAPQPPPGVSSPDMLGPYRLVRRLGLGGMAEVWLARQWCMGAFEREVVIKRVLPYLAHEPRLGQMLLNEARLAACINHPNIAQVFDVGEADGTYYLAMEYVRGVNLLQLMERYRAQGQWLRPEWALRLVAECCKGLGYAHSECNILHRDVTPANILVSVEGAVKLVDFGIAKAMNQVSVTDPGMLKGKYAYMSPEQAQGKPLDPRSDLFTLGLVLYELLTGVRPLEREGEMPTLRAAVVSEIAPPSTTGLCAPEWDALVMRALHKNPDQRYANAREFQLALEHALVGGGRRVSSVHLSQEVKRLFPERPAQAPARPPARAVALGAYDAEAPTTEHSAPRFEKAFSGSNPTREPALTPSREVSKTARKSSHRVYVAGGSAMLALMLMMVIATRTVASPLKSAQVQSGALGKGTASQAVGKTNGAAGRPAGLPR